MRAAYRLVLVARFGGAGGAASDRRGVAGTAVGVARCELSA